MHAQLCHAVLLCIRHVSQLVSSGYPFLICHPSVGTVHNVLVCRCVQHSMKCIQFPGVDLPPVCIRDSRVLFCPGEHRCAARDAPGLTGRAGCFSDGDVWDRSV